ncbi:DUF87 domain-containing protein [Thalassoglobus sp. JC818]|uniref:helicase HerA domain-containing protein n=1 Tax=Thalassoglobus sp. JC818 TaxID=3232136 RepID=UPI00345A04EA
MFDYEKLGAFYLGREYDLESSSLQPDFVMYDAKDLTTHAVIVGMTGSGKTGLGVTLLEEAAIDGIPALIIDPKGDMGNLLLNFPKLAAEDFLPWIDKDAASRAGRTPEEYAADKAEQWKSGLADWDQQPERIQKLRDAAEVAIFTPGSDAGIPISVLKSFDAPPEQVRDSKDVMRERVSNAVSGLLTLLGVDADPIQSREHILLSNILDSAWRQGRNLNLPALIGEIQKPPFDKIGVMDLETIFPAKDRLQLAMTINNILASPSFAAWTHGEPMNIQNLLYNDEGKPRLAILSIAHLNDQERMFFVTLLLNELVSWMRAQPGTSSLRAILYMDEVFGYLPPTANPPSKIPMLTLLKQARAFGLGLILSTQNPVDLDYKALSNAGTWFLGRLQTQRDQQRVLDGLEGASASAGVLFDRKKIEQTLSGVGSRVFLLNNVHEDHPVLMQTRWVLSYLSGPMTRKQISDLMTPFKEQQAEDQSEPAKTEITPEQVVDSKYETLKPILPPDIKEFHIAVRRDVSRDAQIVYTPALLAQGTVHYVDSKSNVDCWRDISCIVPLSETVSVPRDPWSSGTLSSGHDFEKDARVADGVRYTGTPKSCGRKTSYRSWSASFKTYLYREQRLHLLFCDDLDKYSRPEDREGDFRAQIRQLAREKRDLEIAKLRKKYESKMQTLQERVRKAEHRVEEEKEQANSATVSAAVSIGTSILGALFGRKTFSSTNVSRAGTSMRSASRAANQRGDIRRAEAEVDKLLQDVHDLEAELNEQLDEIREEYSDEEIQIEEYLIKPRKSDISAEPVAVIWLPHTISADHTLIPAADPWMEADSAN